ncbi:MAG TPA: ABC transporter permease [Blastocatellia bacterium]|nr:ABC transporter permease [Blastocatellia bacterium]
MTQFPMDSLFQDIKYGVRKLLKDRSFTAVAVFALSLGIGANSAIFSVVNSVVLRPLPYKDSDRLVTIYSSLRQTGLEKIVVSAPELADFREQNNCFDQVAAYDFQGVNVTGGDEPERIRASLLSPNLLPVLGINPIIGRGFAPDEDQPGQSQVTVLSYSIWQRRFAGEPNVIGKTLDIDGKSIEVIGVMPFDFRFPDPDTELYLPLTIDPELLTENNRGSHFLNVVARLKPGVSIDRAQADMNTIAQRMSIEHSSTYRTGYGASVIAMRDDIVGEVRPTLLILLGAVGFVLLIACANVANLLLARGVARQKEVAVRTALGATRVRLIRQLLTESTILAIIAGGLGLLLALWGVEFLVSLSPASIPRLNEISLDARVVAVTMSVSLLTGLLFGLAPAMQFSKPDLNETLKDVGRNSTDGRQRQRLRGLLVISELALSVVLLIGAGLMIRSFIRVQVADPGFNAENLLTMRLSLPRSKYPDFNRQTRFFQDLIERIQAQPGVQSTATINVLPLSGSTADRSFKIEGRNVIQGEPGPDEELRFISSGYFSTMGIPLLRGRAFTQRDNSESPRVAIVNQALADRYWSRDAIGKRIAYSGLGEGKPNWCEIIGVAGNVKHLGPDIPAKPEVYLPFLQPLFSTATSTIGPMYLVTRTATQPEALTGAVRGAIESVDSNQPVSNVRTMAQRISTALAQRRFNMLLLGIFAGVALLLASIGIYGVMSFAVTQRTRELGIRMALGASASDVLRLVLGQGLALTLIGVAGGLAASFVLTSLINSLLYEVSATDSLTFAAVSVILIIVSTGACFVPAVRAMKVDPMVALKHE